MELKSTYSKLSGQSSKGRTSLLGSTLIGLEDPLDELVLDMDGGVTSIMYGEAASPE